MDNQNQPIIDTTSKQDEYIEILKKHFPSVISQLDDGSYLIDKEQLQLMVDPKNCKIIEDGYGLKWVGKKEAYHNAYIHNNKILKPLVEDSKHFDNTKNILIKGDNLDALKLLKKNYFEKIKMIYIDPPYNTQSDGFIYNDNFTKSQEDVLEELGYSPEQKEYIKNIAGAKTHSGWLSFMYPRLLLARDLLKDDGVVFIHIDENEQANLKLLCDEVFGEINYVGNIIWDKGNPKGDSNRLSYQHEEICIYAKDLAKYNQNNEFMLSKENAEKMLAKANILFRKLGKKSVPTDLKQIIKKYDLSISDDMFEQVISLEDINFEFQDYLKKQSFSNGEKAYKYIDENGDVYQTVSMAAPDKPETRSHKPLIHPLTGKPCPVPDKGWRYTNEALDILLSERKIIFGTNELTQPRNKYLLKENMKESVSSILRYAGDDSAKLKKIGIYFENPKPVAFSVDLISIICPTDTKNHSNIILDFFAGSGTTGDAVMQLNAKDGGNRKFILVQLPEKIDPKKSSEAYKFVSEELKKEPTIFEITAERLRRAGQKILKDNEESKDPKDLSSLDIGFKVYEVANDQYNSIYDKKFHAVSQEELALIKSDDIVKADSLTILTNLLLGSGITLDTKIDVLIADSLYRVDDKLFILKEFDLLSELFNGIEYATIYARYFTNDSFINNLKSFINEDKIIVKG